LSEFNTEKNQAAMKRKNYSLLSSLLAIFFICGCGVKGPLYETQEQPTAVPENATKPVQKSD
jgi:predicted small lipoprotein YifL